MFATALIGLDHDGGCTEDEPEDFGTVRIEMSPLAGKTDMFNGTTEIIATVHYETCLQDFYLNRQPNFQKAGPTARAVFEDWATRLCTDEFSDIPNCEVTKIEQVLVDDERRLHPGGHLQDQRRLDHRLPRGPRRPAADHDFAGCGDKDRTRASSCSSRA